MKKEIISNELLKKALNISGIVGILEIDKSIHNSRDIKFRYVDITKDRIFTINIHELANRCKEWSWENGFYYWYENHRLHIKELYSCKVDFEIDIGEFKKPFDVKIDFKACQWILDNKYRLLIERKA